MIPSILEICINCRCAFVMSNHLIFVFVLWTTTIVSLVSCSECNWVNYYNNQRICLSLNFTIVKIIFRFKKLWRFKYNTETSCTEADFPCHIITVCYKTCVCKFFMCYEPVFYLVFTRYLPLRVLERKKSSCKCSIFIWCHKLLKTTEQVFCLKKLA